MGREVGAVNGNDAACLNDGVKSVQKLSLFVRSGGLQLLEGLASLLTPQSNL
jgi:hypothetical protein